MKSQRLFTSARHKLLVTGIGQDRRSMSRDISTLIFNEEGNITNSSITKSHQNFTLTFLVEILEKNLSSFKESIQKSREKLSIDLYTSELADQSQALLSKSLPTNAVLSVVSEEDLKVSSVLLHLFNESEAVVNKIETKTFSAPMGGTELFKTLAYVTVNQDFLRFYERIREVEDERIVSVEIRSEVE